MDGTFDMIHMLRMLRKLQIVVMLYVEGTWTARILLLVVLRVSTMVMCPRHGVTSHIMS